MYEDTVLLTTTSQPVSLLSVRKQPSVVQPVTLACSSSLVGNCRPKKPIQHGCYIRLLQIPVSRYGGTYFYLSIL